MPGWWKNVTLWKTWKSWSIRTRITPRLQVLLRRTMELVEDFYYLLDIKVISGPEKSTKNYRKNTRKVDIFQEQKIAIQRNGICCCCFFFFASFRLGPNFLGFFRIQETEARNVDEEIKSLRRTETDLRRAIAAHRRCANGRRFGEFS